MSVLMTLSDSNLGFKVTRNVGLNKVQEDANTLPLSTLWRSEIARVHGVAHRFTRSMR